MSLQVDMLVQVDVDEAQIPAPKKHLQNLSTPSQSQGHGEKQYLP